MSDIQEKVNAVVARYQPEIDRLKQEGQRLQDDFEKPGSGEAAIGAKFKVTWAEKEVVFDIPQFTIKDEKIVLDLPTITMNRQRIVFDTPSVRMVRKVVGKHPEFHGPFTIKWKDIIIHVPEPFMERQEIVYDLPTVRMDRTEMTLGIPQVSMKPMRWVLRLPEFTLVDVSAEVDQVKGRGEELKRRGEELGARMRSEIELAVGGAMGPIIQEAAQVRDRVATGFASAITSVGKAIDDLAARKLDPIKVPMEDGSTVNLRKTLDDLVTQRDRGTGTVDAALARLPR